MRNLSRKLSILLAAVLCLSLAGAAFASEPPSGTKGQGKYEGDTRVIRIATWYDYAGMYVSNQAIDDLDEYLTNPESSEVRFARLKEIEKEYNVKFEYVRTTFDGIQISLDEGVLSGRPEADIYETDINFGMNYALNDYCYALEDLADPDDDVFNKQEVFTPLKFPSQDKTYMFANYREESNVYVLGFNWTLLQAKGLENPQDLWDRGEWTWDVFLDYCTKLTDLSGAVPVYGFTGLWTNDLNGFLRSNDAHIAATPEGGLTSAATGEVLDMFKKLYVDLKVGRPWNTDTWEVNNRYSDGSAAFFTAANWILNDSGANYGGGMDHPLSFEIGVVPFPVGPNGNKDTNNHHSVSGNYYVIPKGVENPKLVYDAFYALRDWYEGDYENTRVYDVLDPDDVPLTWSEQIMVACALGDERLAENNVRLYNMTMQSVSFDPWESMGINAGDSGDFSMVPIMNGEMTPAQFQETFKQPLEFALQTVYK